MVSIEGLKSASSHVAGSENLQTVLTAWNFQRIPVPGDGNCLFTSLASAILHRIRNGDTLLITILKNIIKDIDSCYVSTLAERLRQWMGENYELYQSFVTVDLREEGQEFMQSGQFTGEVGDLMVFTLSNILQSPIAIFTSIPNLPVICITPMFVHAENDNPIFLTFIQEGL